MKKILLMSCVAVFSLTLIFFESNLVGATDESPTPLAGKIIALDAGHGGSDLGATYPANEGGSADVYEKDINLVTVYALKERLETAGATVVLTRVADEEISGRRERVKIAEQRCEEEGGECNILVSVHHNGATDETVDGVLTIYNNKDDFPLAESLRSSLLDGLFNNEKKYDKGYLKGGYGMTVYFTPASLTEGYYVTNRCEAHLFNPGAGIVTSSDSWENCEIEIYGEWNGVATTTLVGSYGDVLEYEVNHESGTHFDIEYGTRRVEREADALFDGIMAYFKGLENGNGGDNGDDDNEGGDGGDEDVDSGHPGKGPDGGGPPGRN